MELVAMSQRAMNGDLAESYVTVPFGRPLVEPLVNDVNPPVDGTQPIESPWEALRRRLSAPAGTPQGKLATT
jgi:hypothetical protein